jgi:hypothetical protein
VQPSIRAVWVSHLASRVSSTCLCRDLQALFVGSSITIYSRQLKLIDYGDDYTRAQLEAKSERYTAGCW